MERAAAQLLGGDCPREARRRKDEGRQDWGGGEVSLATFMSCATATRIPSFGVLVVLALLRQLLHASSSMACCMAPRPVTCHHTLAGAMHF
eukprot:355370-Chlamydomonas_euryale.AAC.5